MDSRNRITTSTSEDVVSAGIEKFLTGLLAEFPVGSVSGPSPSRLNKPIYWRFDGSSTFAYVVPQDCHIVYIFNTGSIQFALATVTSTQTPTGGVRTDIIQLPSAAAGHPNLNIFLPQGATLYGCGGNGVECFMSLDIDQPSLT